MSRVSSMVGIKVNGEWYRCEEYRYSTCSEVLVRGPFPGGPFKQNGKPVFFTGLKTAFKTVGKKCMQVNSKKSTKKWYSDPSKLAPWEPFALAYAQKNGWEVEA